MEFQLIAEVTASKNKLKKYVIIMHSNEFIIKHSSASTVFYGGQEVSPKLKMTN